jgi:hypothetical protein
MSDWNQHPRQRAAALTRLRDLPIRGNDLFFVESSDDDHHAGQRGRHVDILMPDGLFLILEPPDLY